MFAFHHFNFNVKDLDKSLEFYVNLLGFKVIRRRDNEDKGFKMVFLGDESTGFLLELTWLRDHPEPYDLGEQEFHLALVTDDYEAEYNKHKEMGIIVYDNQDMGIYFLEDPDGYWIEIVPRR